MTGIKILIDEARPFYSYLDESHFFCWLEEIDAISEIKRDGSKLALTCSFPITEACFRDLIALCFRYSVDMRPLLALSSLEHDSWLKNSGTYWHEKMFGSEI